MGVGSCRGVVLEHRAGLPTNDGLGRAHHEQELAIRTRPRPYSLVSVIADGLQHAGQAAFVGGPADRC